MRTGDLKDILDQPLTGRVSPQPKRRLSLPGWLWLLPVGLLANAGLWGGTLSYLDTAPLVYTTNWAVIVPGSDSQVSLSLAEVGQASSDSSFLYSAADPRANYQYIASSQATLDQIAAQMGISVDDLGKIKVLLPESSNVIEFIVEGPSPEAAQQQSQVLYTVLVEQVNQLRIEELIQREEGSQVGLQSAQSKLRDAQDALSNYKIQSSLSTSDQLSELSVNVEQLRKNYVDLQIQQQDSEKTFTELSSLLDISPEQAVDAFILQSDQQFRQYLSTYSEATATLNDLQSKWGINHPEVVKQVARQEAAQAALASRSLLLVGSPLDEATLALINLSNTAPGGAREQLFQDVISVQIERSSLQAQSQALNQELDILENRLRQFAQEESIRDQLERDVQIAEAVFAATLARQDLSKSDIYTAYPLIQKLSEPYLPKEPSAPKTKFILLGAAATSIVFTISLIWFGLGALEKRA